ncbi:MAG TPA: DUF4350 domain-containing protein [Demequinaceae bacterium]
MTATSVATAQGFTVAPASPTLRTRVWRGRFWWSLVLVFSALLAVVVASTPSKDSALLSLNNPGSDGARATGEILRGRGLDVRQITRLGAARIATPQDTTLAVVLPSNIVDYQIESVLAYPGDIVFVGVSPDLLTAIDPSLGSADSPESTLRGAQCNDPDAIAAGRISTGGAEIDATRVDGATVCFRSAPGIGPFVVLQRAGRTITLLSDATLPMNGNLIDYGNAALVFRALGKHPTLVWYLGNPLDTSTLTYSDGSGTGSNPGGNAAEPSADFLPPGTGTALYALAIAVLIAAIWRGRRMGPLVTEALPVVVPSSETTRGRARLYRRARAYGRASASLRAAAAERMGRRLGVPRGGDAATLIRAVARATGREPLAVERLVYGPPPDGEHAMMDLVQELDTLERQVHRP